MPVSQHTCDDGNTTQCYEQESQAYRCLSHFTRPTDMFPENSLYVAARQEPILIALVQPLHIGLRMLLGRHASGEQQSVVCCSSQEPYDVVNQPAVATLATASRALLLSGTLLRDFLALRTRRILRRRIFQQFIRLKDVNYVGHRRIAICKLVTPIQINRGPPRQNMKGNNLAAPVAPGMATRNSTHGGQSTPFVMPKKANARA